MLCDTVAMYKPIAMYQKSNNFVECTNLYVFRIIHTIYKINCRFCQIVLFFVCCYILRLAFLSIGPAMIECNEIPKYIYIQMQRSFNNPDRIDNEISKFLLFYFEIRYAHMYFIRRLCQNIFAVYEYSLYMQNFIYLGND